MNPHNISHLPRRPLWLALVATWLLLALTPLGWGAAAKTNAPPAGKGGASTNAPAPPKEPIKSVFDTDLDKGGKDPFFPNSPRRRPAEIVNPSNPHPNPGQAASAIPLPVFNGIIKGARNRRMVVLNDQTFFAGDKTKMVLGGAIHEVKCLEIRDDMVVIQLDGKRTESIPIPKE